MRYAFQQWDSLKSTKSGQNDFIRDYHKMLQSSVLHSLRSKRFRAVLEQRTRNENQRPHEKWKWNAIHCAYHDRKGIRNRSEWLTEWKLGNNWLNSVLKLSLLPQQKFLEASLLFLYFLPRADRRLEDFHHEDPIDPFKKRQRTLNSKKKTTLIKGLTNQEKHLDAEQKIRVFFFLLSWVLRCAVTPARAWITDFCYAGCNNGYIEVDHTSKTREKSVDENHNR